MQTHEILAARLHDLGGGFVVRRLLPAAARASVGPFVFFDHFGPVQAQPGDNHDVRPHPHIGLSTVTYLFEGAMQHRDSTGAVQRMEPGQLNWMTAGQGIVHSERTPDDLRDQPRVVHGLQLWMALPADQEECAPSFHHFEAEAIPKVPLEGACVVLIGGEPLGPRHSVWNFVSSRRERLLQAREDWQAQRFPAIAGETEYIPFPASRA